jgi:hypothetical protein
LHYTSPDFGVDHTCRAFVDLPYITLIMPGEVITEPNPKPQPSHLPDYLEKLSVKLDQQNLDQKSCDALLKFRRAASYIAAGEL